MRINFLTVQYHQWILFTPENILIVIIEPPKSSSEYVNRTSTIPKDRTLLNSTEGFTIDGPPHVVFGLWKRLDERLELLLTTKIKALNKCSFFAIVLVLALLGNMGTERLRQCCICGVQSTNNFTITETQNCHALKIQSFVYTCLKVSILNNSLTDAMDMADSDSINNYSVFDYSSYTYSYSSYYVNLTLDCPDGQWIVDTKRTLKA